MKIANCKYCGTPAQMCTDSNGTHIYCPDCLQDDGYTDDVLDCAQQDAIDKWNSLNTDQHGQQLQMQTIQWVEWDGDIEHLPPNGTRIVLKRNGIIFTGVLNDAHNKYLVPYVDTFCDATELILGDLFAVVED